MRNDIRKKYMAIIEHISVNGVCTTKQIGTAVFKLTGAAASNVTSCYLRKMKRMRVVNDIKCSGRTLKWELTGYVPDDWREPEVINTENLFKPAYVHNNRPCYSSEKGFVHIYSPGQKVCNCKLEKNTCH